MFHVVIPARYAASRLPGKPLLPIAGKPLLQWVWQRACASGAASVLIATDDERIRIACEGFGADCVMTSTEHVSGTDRIAEAVHARALPDADIIVNLQGDEPMMPPAVISELAAALAARPSVDIATAVAPIGSLGDFLDPNCVKALRGGDGRGLYFSRAAVPWPRDSIMNGRPTTFAAAWRHVGIYAYRVRSLLQFAAWPPTLLESTEKLEQLRALENGMHIHLMTLAEPPPSGVDTPEDVLRVSALMQFSSSAAG